MSQNLRVAAERLDKWLWKARFFRSRTLAAKMVAQRRVRVNQAVVTKCHHQVKPGDVLTFVQGRDVRVVRVRQFTDQREPAAKARTLYDDVLPARTLTESPTFPCERNAA